MSLSCSSFSSTASQIPTRAVGYGYEMQSLCGVFLQHATKCSPHILGMEGREGAQKLSSRSLTMMLPAVTACNAALIHEFSATTNQTPPPKRKKTDDFHGTLEALRSKNRIPKKWLGQHYMVNQEINEKLIQTANIKKNDLVLEIGPGTGSLTNYLVEAGAHVIAVEKDPAMAELIIDRFHESGQVEVVQEDFMKWPIRNSIDGMKEKLSENGISCRMAKVVSNLPFNITTPVVKQILPMGDIFSSMVLLIQDETASRLVGVSPQCHEYRSMSLFVQFFSDARYELKVTRNNFFPPPKVDAAIVSFRIKQPTEYPSVLSDKSFFTLVNSAFSGKRKMLRKSLQHLYPCTEIQEALRSLDLLETIWKISILKDIFISCRQGLMSFQFINLLLCTTFLIRQKQSNHNCVATSFVKLCFLP